jgi:Arc-like DNA binding domain
MNKTLNEIKTQVRFPHDVWEEIKRLAVLHERSSNGEIVFAMREYTRNQQQVVRDIEQTTVDDQTKRK